MPKKKKKSQKQNKDTNSKKDEEPIELTQSVGSLVIVNSGDGKQVDAEKPKEVVINDPVPPQLKESIADLDKTEQVSESDKKEPLADTKELSTETVTPEIVATKPIPETVAAEPLTETHKKEQPSEIVTTEQLTETHKKEQPSETVTAEPLTETHKKEQQTETHKKEQQTETVMEEPVIKSDNDDTLTKTMEQSENQLNTVPSETIEPKVVPVPSDFITEPVPKENPKQKTSIPFTFPKMEIKCDMGKSVIRLEPIEPELMHDKESPIVPERKTCYMFVDFNKEYQMRRVCHGLNTYNGTFVIYDARHVWEHRKKGEWFVKLQVDNDIYDAFDNGSLVTRHMYVSEFYSIFDRAAYDVMFKEGIFHKNVAKEDLDMMFATVVVTALSDAVRTENKQLLKYVMDNYSCIFTETEITRSWTYTTIKSKFEELSVKESRNTHRTIITNNDSSQRVKVAEKRETTGSIFYDYLGAISLSVVAIGAILLLRQT